MTTLSRELLFEENLKRRIFDISVQVKHAIQRNISNVAKSGYFRSAIILGGTIVEGLLFRLVEGDINVNNKCLGNRTVYKHPHNIPLHYSNKNIVLCIKHQEEILLSTQTTFSDLIMYAQSNGLITKIEAKKIDFVRKIRNKIHLQSLDEKDCGYTKGKLNKVFDAIVILITK